MKCPLMKVEYDDLTRCKGNTCNHIAEWQLCIEKDCAWWNENQCCIKSIVNKLSWIKNLSIPRGE